MTRPSAGTARGLVLRHRRPPITTSTGRPRRLPTVPPFPSMITEPTGPNVDVPPTASVPMMVMSFSPLPPRMATSQSSGDGLCAGGEVSIATVDRPDGQQPRARNVPDARLAVGIERESRHHLLAHEECDGAGRHAGPRLDGGHRGREGHRPAGDGPLDRRPRATVVASRFTVTAATAELLPVKPPLPAKEAVSAWSPTPSDTARVAWPAALTGAVPSTVAPSRKVTRPVGMPAGELDGRPSAPRSARRRRSRSTCRASSSSSRGLPVAEVHGQPDQIGGQARGVHHVVAAEGVDRQRVVRPSEPVMLTKGDRPATAMRRRCRRPRSGRASSPSVPLTMTASAWPSPAPAGAAARFRLTVRAVRSGR